MLASSIETGPDRGLLFWAVALFLVLTAVYVSSIGIRATRGASITGDEPFYLLTTESLLADRDLDLHNQYRDKSYEAFFDHPNGLWRQSVPSFDGRLLSPHNPGLSVLLVPGYAAGGLPGVQVQLMLIAAGAMTLGFVLSDRLTGQRAASGLAALGVGIGAVAFIHSTEIYPEFPAALTLLLSLLAVTGRGRPGLSEGLWTAAFLSATCWLGVKYAPLVVLVAGYFLLRADTRGRVALLAIGVASAALYAWFHLETFGGLTPYSVNVVYAGQTTVELFGEHVGFGDRFYRLWGLFVDRRFGVGHWVPLLLLVVPGLVLLARGSRPQRLVLALIVAQVLIASFVVITMMGWWFPGRMLVTVVPLLVVPVTLVAVSAPAKGRAVMAALAVYGAVITAGLAWAGHAGEITIAVDPFEMRFLPFRGVAWLFPDYRVWTLQTWLLTAVWLTLAASSMACASPYRMLWRKVLSLMPNLGAQGHVSTCRAEPGERPTSSSGAGQLRQT